MHRLRIGFFVLELRAIEGLRRRLRLWHPLPALASVRGEGYRVSARRQRGRERERLICLTSPEHSEQEKKRSSSASSEPKRTKDDESFQLDFLLNLFRKIVSRPGYPIFD